jgi:alpha-methylacyl-CoA racemase
MAGPLAGVRIIELAGLGPVPLAGMFLADMGADIVRIDRPHGTGTGTVPHERELLHRGRPSIAIDLKSANGADVLLRMVDQADVLLEGLRPGVTERLGVGPDVCLARNPRLVYGRMTGWGQNGPLAPRVGHDINYIGLTGALAAIGRADGKPVPPLNLVGDFGGGTMFLVAGVLAALIERSNSGRGQVVDAAMVDGAAYLLSMIYSFLASGLWEDRPGANLLDGGAPFYDTYECADGKFVAVGAIETQFYAQLLETLGITDAPGQFERERWPELRDRLQGVFRSKTRDEWASVFAEVDACVSPILTLTEAPNGEHLHARGTFTTSNDIVQPSPAPRLSRTPGQVGVPPRPAGADTTTALPAWGFSDDEIATLLENGAVWLDDQL